VKFVNERIAAARAGMPLHGLQPIRDPSDEIIEVHLAALKWNILQRRFGLVASDLMRLQSSSAELLELLKSNLPDKTGEAAGWNFEKAHSILHKVREILLYGWSENFSTQATILYFIYDFMYDFIYDCMSELVNKFNQGPEHCHIDFCKRLAQCTNNKDVFLCIMRWHVRAGHLQYLRSLDVDAADAEAEGQDMDEGEVGPRIAGMSQRDCLSSAGNDYIPCELGIRYPTLQAIMSGKRNMQTTLV
jgi:hypothetical protein